MKKQSLPSHVVSEFLGSVEFGGSTERQLYLAEQIASGNYSDMEQLIETTRGFVKNQKVYHKMVQGLRDHEFYKKHFVYNQIKEAVIQDMKKSDPED